MIWNFIVYSICFFIPNRKVRIRVRNKMKFFLIYHRVRTKAKSVGEGLWINGPVTINNNTYLGTRACFNGMTIHGHGKVTIGSYFHSGQDCLIFTQNHNYDNGTEIPYDSTYVLKEVSIGDCVWLGTQVIILPGTKIGEGVIVQAGSVVHGDIPDYAIIGGNPAKVFKYRDIDHFKKLKSEGKFH